MFARTLTCRLPSPSPSTSTLTPSRHATTQSLKVSVIKPGPISTPALIEFMTQEQATQMKQIWPKSIAEDFSGKAGECLVYYSSVNTGATGSEEVEGGVAGGIPERFVWVGLGEEEKVTLKGARAATATALGKVSQLKLKEAALTFDPTNFSALPVSTEELVHTITKAAISTTYKFEKYLTKKEDFPPPLEQLTLSTKSPNGSLSSKQVLSLRTAASMASSVAQATNYARDLANERADICNPAYMEQQARELVEKYPELFEIEVIQFEELKEKGLNMLAAVGQAATSKPRLILLKYKGGTSPDSAPVALVGKGVTFDTGGLNLKPTNFIEEMYMDMGGSAAVMATMSALPALNITQNVVGVLAMAENAIDSQSYFPSQILTSYKGLTVEVGNTDAEGRLVLADALSYVQEQHKPHTVIDLATLTGACVVALGEHASGLFTNNDELKEALVAASEKSGERAWPMPLYEEYTKEMKGTQADLTNSGKTRYGGAATAAAFLQEFIEEGVHWSHIDIAGPAMSSEARADIPKGGTGYGVQLLLQYLQQTEAAASATKPEE